MIDVIMCLIMCLVVLIIGSAVFLEEIIEAFKK